MPNWLRALIAGYGAKKLGGGCFSTILIFIVIWYALGQCGGNRSNNMQTYPNNGRTMVVPAKPSPVTAYLHTIAKL